MKERLIKIKAIIRYLFNLPFVTTYVLIIAILLCIFVISFTYEKEQPYIHKLTDNNLTYYIYESGDRHKRKIILEDEVIKDNLKENIIIHNSEKSITIALCVLFFIGWGLLTIFFWIFYGDSATYKEILIDYLHKQVYKVKDNDGTFIYVLFNKIICRSNEDVYGFYNQINIYLNNKNILDDFEGTKAEIRSNKITKLLNI